MSYDISLEVDTGAGNTTDAYSWNYTSNCSWMWRDAGADLAEMHDKTAGDCAPIIAAAARRIESNINYYRAWNPSNGWGDADQLAVKLYELAGACREHPATRIRVSR